MHRRTFLLLLLLCAGAMVLTALAAPVPSVATAPPAAPAADRDVKEAIVKIYTYHDVPDYQNPWSRRGTFSSTGSGCVIKGKRILTNAHVVSDETFIQVRRYGDPKRYPARVLSVSHAADVALLTVDDPDFFGSVAPLELGDLPRAQQEVMVYGFPLGGDTLSITKGVVSRVEHQTYAHSSCHFLAVQIDAAINPGNSGGPALVSNRVVGVAMQGISQADNIGYIVPAPIIQHFLTDIEDGRYDGFPSLGIVMEGMENRDLKKKYGLSEKETGMLLVSAVRGSAAEGVLQTGDVLLAVEGHPIADDGTVEFREKERTSVSYYIQAHQLGDPLTAEILRNGQRQNVTVKLVRPMEGDWLIPMEQYGVLPSYFVYGGLVFCPLTVNYLKSWGPNWYDQAPDELLAMLGFNYRTDERDEVVLVLKVLAADANQGYQDISNWVVTEVNGKKIKGLKDLVDAVERDAAEPFVKFSNKWGQQIVLGRERVAKNQAEILDTYRIRENRSADLK
ncbi:MAG: serine protease [Verrucomicrobiota bacterium]